MRVSPVLSSVLALGAVGALAGCAALEDKTADTIYTGGTIITINDDSPKAEAVAVKDGRILATGTLDDLSGYIGEATERFDLDGRTMIPGFVDSHGHVVMGGLQALSANLLAPPDGEVTDIASLLATLKDWTKANEAAVASAKVIIGFGYDNAQLSELRHPTRDELDTVSTEYPIIIVHQSGHIGVANSKALEMAGMTKDTPNPAGGVIRRAANGEPNGVLEEYAFFSVIMPVMANLGSEGLQEFARAGSKLWASYGYTTAQEGRASGPAVEALKAVGADGQLPIDVVAFPDVLESRDYIKANKADEYADRVRVGGCKLTIDGSPQGFTALRDKPYYDPVGDYPEGYKGYAAISNDQLTDAVNWCYENGYQILVHSNGEGASDMLIAALRGAREKYGDPGNRPVLIHGQFLREDQLDAYQELGVFPSLFPMHTFYWGDWHRNHTVGPEAAENISPTGWVRQREMMFGTHHDAPVAFPNSMRVLDATVTRRTRSGYILGKDQRVDALTALKAMTIWPAWQHFEEDEKGSIETGKQADFVILSADPTAVEPETIASIDVLVTINDGNVVYEASQDIARKSAVEDLVARNPDLAHAMKDALYAGFAGRTVLHSHRYLRRRPDWWPMALAQ